MTPNEIYEKAKHYSEYTSPLSENFSWEEMACRSTGKVYVEKELIRKLECLREKLGDKPIVCTSAYRSPEHNKKVGGAKDSRHMYGQAVDISCVNINGNKLVKLAVQCGFTFIIRYPEKNFVHLDIRPLERDGFVYPVKILGKEFPEKEEESRFIQSQESLESKRKLPKKETVAGIAAAIGVTSTMNNKDILGNEIPEIFNKGDNIMNFLNLEGVNYLIQNINLTTIGLFSLLAYFLYDKFLKDRLNKDLLNNNIFKTSILALSLAGVLALINTYGHYLKEPISNNIEIEKTLNDKKISNVKIINTDENKGPEERLPE